MVILSASFINYMYSYSGPIDAASLTPARIALSVPLVNSFTHPLVAGPVLASHPLDVQDFPSMASDPLASPVAHVGPPSINIEAKLVGVDDELVENGADPVGVLLIRGPPVGTLLGMEDYVAVPASDEEDGWVGTGKRAKVQSNGSFKVLTR
jgi:long-chain acyl-CoA synthetase